MTKQRAIEKAKQLWGDNAIAMVTDTGKYIIGEKTDIFFAQYGWGRNWEEAFNSAKYHFN